MVEPYITTSSFIAGNTEKACLPNGCYWVYSFELKSLCFTGQNVIFESDPGHSRYRYLNESWQTVAAGHDFPHDLEVEQYVFDNDLLLDLPIKSWYLREFPSDDIFSSYRYSSGINAYGTVTFKDILTALENSQNICNLLPYSSLLRERIFSEISFRKNVDVSDIHKMWALTPEFKTVDTFDKNSYAGKILSARSNNPTFSSPALSVKQHSLDY